MSLHVAGEQEVMRERERVVVWHARPTKGGSSKPAQRESGTLYVVCMDSICESACGRETHVITVGRWN